MLNAEQALEVTVRVYDNESKSAERASVTYSLNEGESRRVTEVAPDGWIEITVGNETVWEELVESYEHFELSLEEGHATIDHHAMV